MGLITKESAAKILLQNDNFTILCHASPDGDTIGSGTALCLALQKIGKAARVLCADKVSERFDFCYTNIDKSYWDSEFQDEYVVSVDVADDKLLGEFEEIYKGKIQLSIDHHSSNTMFAENVCLDASSGANTENIFDIINLMGVEIDGNIAAAIYLGIITDTGCFKFQNTTPRTHIIAARLMEYDFNYARLNYIFFEMKSKNRLLFEKKAMEDMEFYFDGKLAVIVLHKELLDTVDDTDIDGVSALSRQIEGVELGLTLKEKEKNVWKASLRSNEKINSQLICKSFGGGGHMRAAGCKLNGTLSECKERLIKEVEKYI